MQVFRSVRICITNYKHPYILRFAGFWATIYGSDSKASIVEFHKRTGHDPAAWNPPLCTACIIGIFGHLERLKFLAQSAAPFLRCDRRAPAWPLPRVLPRSRSTYHHGVIIRFDGEIGPGLETYLYRKLDAAKQQGADLVIVEIDSPGGELLASLRIAEHLQKLDWAHTVAYVPQRAISGAAIVSLGCDEIVMAPHARHWRRRPHRHGRDSLFRLRSEKMISFLARRPAQPGRSQRSPAGPGRGHGRQGSQGLSCSQSEDRPENLYFPARPQRQAGRVEEAGSGCRLRQRPISWL